MNSFFPKRLGNLIHIIVKNAKKYRTFLLIVFRLSKYLFKEYPALGLETCTGM